MAGFGEKWHDSITPYCSDIPRRLLLVLVLCEQQITFFSFPPCSSMIDRRSIWNCNSGLHSPNHDKNTNFSRHRSTVMDEHGVCSRKPSTTMRTQISFPGHGVSGNGPEKDMSWSLLPKGQQWDPLLDDHRLCSLSRASFDNILPKASKSGRNIKAATLRAHACA